MGSTSTSWDIQAGGFWKKTTSPGSVSCEWKPLYPRVPPPKPTLQKKAPTSKTGLINSTSLRVKMMMHLFLVKRFFRFPFFGYRIFQQFWGSTKNAVHSSLGIYPKLPTSTLAKQSDWWDWWNGKVPRKTSKNIWSHLTRVCTPKSGLVREIPLLLVKYHNVARKK